jgi:hypothetical protein
MERPFLFRATQGGDKIRLNGEEKTIKSFSFSPEGPGATHITVNFSGGSSETYELAEFDQMEVTLIEGNPGEQPLMVTLDELANFVGYEAKVVEVAAENIDDPGVKQEAEQQAEAMEDAAESLHEAAEQAADTASEVFNETGVPSDEQGAEVVAGNPAAEQLPNAPATRQEAGQALQVGTGQPGQHAIQPQTIVGVGNPVVQGITPSNRVGVANRASGGARNALVGNPGDPGESVHALAAELDRVKALDWNSEADKEAVVTALERAIQALEGANSFGYVTGGNPDLPEPLEDAAETVAEAETVTEDEPPAIEHWYFRSRNVGKKLKIG